MRFETAVVTGATGHVGNVLVRQLVDSGKEVRAFVLEGEDTRSLEGLPARIVTGDVSDTDSLVEAFAGCDVVFHVAGLVSIAPGHEEALWKVNTQGTLNVIEACRRAGTKRLVYTSSVHALTEPGRGASLDESAGFDANKAYGHYGKSKAAASLAVLQAANDGLEAVLVCPVGVIGPFDFKRSDMGGMFISFAKGRLPAIINGSYDFVDVRDVARGHILACEKGASGESYILSGGRVEIADLMAMLEHITGVEASPPAIPLWLARLAAACTPFYSRITNAKPLLTELSIHTLTSRFFISDRKARAEIDYTSMATERSVRDALDWYREAGYLVQEPDLRPAALRRLSIQGKRWLRNRFPVPSRQAT